MPATATAKKRFDVLAFVIDFEGGDISEERLIEGFQHLIDTGLAWTLQGHYGRMAMALLKQGCCTKP